MTEINWTQIREEALRPFTLEALPPTLKLPALPHAVTLFVQKSNDPNVSLKELGQIVETDTGLTIELLRYVNSTFVGLRSKARSVTQAIALLGARQSKMFLLSTGMQAAVQARNSKFINQACFWNASLQKAIFAREVALLLKTDADVAFAGALLQDYLLPVITNDLLDPYVDFVSRRAEHPECLCVYEQDNFGWNHAAAGACLAHRWQLPDELVCCILFHHDGLRLLTHPVLGRSPAAAVAISALLPDQMRQFFAGLEHLNLLETKWPAFKLQALAAKVDELHQQIGIGVRNDFPLARRCKPAIDGSLDRSDGTLRVTAS